MAAGENSNPPGSNALVSERPKRHSKLPYHLTGLLMPHESHRLKAHRDTIGVKSQEHWDSSVKRAVESLIQTVPGYCSSTCPQPKPILLEL